MLTCEQINDENTHFLRFQHIFTQPDHVRYTGLKPYPQWVPNYLLYSMRPSTAQYVGPLEIFLVLPREEKIYGLSQALSRYPRIKITAVSMSLVGHLATFE